MTRAREVRLHRREFLAQDLSPLAIYRRVAESSGHSSLLESVTGGEQVSRYSFVGASPSEVLRLYPDRLEIETTEGVEVESGQPLEALRRRTLGFEAVPGELPFTGGFIGFFGYDLVRLTESLPSRPPDSFGLPLAQLARFDSLIVFDHARQRLTAVSNEIEGAVDEQEALAALDALTAILQAGGRESLAVEVPQVDESRSLAVEPLVSDRDYGVAVERVREYIAAGDILQAVVARRWRLDGAVAPESLYRALRLVNPSPYMVLLSSPDVSLVGASPEMLVRKTGNRLETRPIAGTRRRGATEAEDRALAAELVADEKECAEHVMLVDLGRNDLGRVAQPGSVEVESLMEVERYSHVMHMVSSVHATIADGMDAFDALLACFPAGTVSGAPKIRAMEIIDELEPEARGPYAGAVGYLSYGGDLDTCITIRTLVVHDDSVSVTAGAGIVADSVAKSEARETENKVAALLAAVELARELERQA
jgi:anthranilate synthase component 1